MRKYFRWIQLKFMFQIFMKIHVLIVLQKKYFSPNFFEPDTFPSAHAQRFSLLSVKSYFSLSFSLFLSRGASKVKIVSHWLIVTKFLLRHIFFPFFSKEVLKRQKIGEFNDKGSSIKLTSEIIEEKSAFEMPINLHKPHASFQLSNCSKMSM